MTKKNDEVSKMVGSEDAPPPDAAIPAAAGAAEAETREAEKKPPIVDPKPPKLSPLDDKTEKRTAEQWADAKETPKWLFAATRVGLQWPRGQEMTEKDFDAGVTWAAHAPCR